MDTYNAELLQTLNQIEGTGSFVVSGTKDFMPLGLAIKGVNEISFPITSAQVKTMIKVAHKAPFGKNKSCIVKVPPQYNWSKLANPTLKSILFFQKSLIL